MSNVQLQFAAGLPTIMALIGIMLSQSSLEKLGKRIDGIDKRIDSVDKRMDSVEQRLDRRFDRVESRLDRIRADLREFCRTIGQHEVRMNTLENRGA